MSDKNLKVEELLRVNREELKLTEKQLKIIEAAIEIFSEKGFASASTSEIAKKAGVAEGTIFRHYKTKKDLLISIVTPTLTKVVAPFMMKNFVKDVFYEDYQSFEDFIRALLKNRFEFAKSHLPIIKIVLQEIAFHPELQEQFKELFTNMVYSELNKIIEHFQAKGEIIHLPTKSVIRVTITTLLGFVISRLLIVPEADWDDEQEIEFTIQFLLRGLSKNEITKPAT